MWKKRTVEIYDKDCFREKIKRPRGRRVIASPFARPFYGLDLFENNILVVLQREQEDHTKYTA